MRRSRNRYRNRGDSGAVILLVALAIFLLTLAILNKS